MSQSIARSPLGSIPKEIAALLGEPSLIRGESPEEFDALLLSVANSVRARDILVWSWCHDVTCHIWEKRRFQRIRAGILVEAQVQVVEELLKSTYDAEDADPSLLNAEKAVLEHLYAIVDAKNEARRWARDPEFGGKIDERLRLRGYDRSSVLAKAYLHCAAPLAQIDRSIADLETRRIVTLREISRHDAAMARRFEELSNVIEGEFTQAAE